MGFSEVAQALIIGLIIAAVYTGFKLSGALENKTNGQALIRLIPAWCIAALIVVVLWS